MSRDAACAIKGDAALLIGPLAALCEKAVRAVTERQRSSGVDAVRLALAQRSQDERRAAAPGAFDGRPGARPARPSRRSADEVRNCRDARRPGGARLFAHAARPRRTL